MGTRDLAVRLMATFLHFAYIDKINNEIRYCDNTPSRSEFATDTAVNPIDDALHYTIITGRFLPEINHFLISSCWK